MGVTLAMRILEKYPYSYLLKNDGLKKHWIKVMKTILFVAVKNLFVYYNHFID